MVKFSSFSPLGTSIETAELTDGSVTVAKLANGATLKLLGTVTLSADATTIGFSSLDYNTTGYFLAIYNLEASSANADNVSLFINDNTTAADYDTQVITGNGAGITGSQTDVSTIARTEASETCCGYAIIFIDPLSKAVAIGSYARDGGIVLNEQFSIKDAASTTANITDLDFTSARADGLDIGSTISLYSIGV